MNASNGIFRRAGFVAIPLLLSVYAMANDAAHVPAVSNGAQTEPKTHTLFMGADVSVERDKNFYRVKDVSGSSFVITVKGEPVFVQASKDPLNLKIERSLKLTTRSASLVNLKGERAYTRGNNPQIQRMHEMSAMMNAVTTTQASVHKEATAAAETAAYAQVAPPEVQAYLIPASEQMIETAAQHSAMINALSRSDFNNSAFYSRKIQEELDQELFDAMEITFEVSSDVPLNNPYAVIVTRFHEKDSKPELVRNWIYAESLAPIDSKPQKVRIKRGGLPPGFVVNEFQVHLYNQGEEVATNVSPKRVALTAEEAFQYVVIEYVAAHKNATLPAVPVMGKLPADFRTRLASGQLKDTFYVKVSKDGRPLEAFVDESCSLKVDDPYLEGVVKEIRFKPALKNGKPVDGIASLALAKLPM